MATKYANTNPIYVYTYFLQRVPTPPAASDGYPGGSGHDIEPHTQAGYRIVPGRLVELWFYNTADAKFKPACNDGGPKLQFWQPNELMSHRTEAFVAEAFKGNITGTVAVNNKLTDLTQRQDVVKIKFTDDYKIPSQNNAGDPYASGVFDQGLGGMWDVANVAAI